MPLAQLFKKRCYIYAGLFLINAGFFLLGRYYSGNDPVAPSIQFFMSSSRAFLLED
jgi:hypothetical protein